MVFPAPLQTRARYMRGSCHLLAYAVAKATGLPLRGMFDADGDMHHVFVYDPERDLAIDIRGVMPLRFVPEGSVAARGCSFRDVTRKEIEAMPYARPNRIESAAAQAAATQLVAFLKDRGILGKETVT